MANYPGTSVLNRFAGKKLVFEGKFGYADTDRTALIVLARAHQGEVLEELDKSVDYLVIPEMTSSKTAQKKAQSLNAKGATIQVIDAPAFAQMAQISVAELVGLFRAGSNSIPLLTHLFGHRFGMSAWTLLSPTATGTVRPTATQSTSTPILLAPYSSVTAPISIVGENFDGLNLSKIPFHGVEFTQCSFVGANLENVNFVSPTRCDFSKADTHKSHFSFAVDCRFVESRLARVTFQSPGPADFSGAFLQSATFVKYSYKSAPQPGTAGCVFTKSDLNKAHFRGVTLLSPEFGGANLQAASFVDSRLESPNFGKANLRNSNFYGCKLPSANFTSADLRGANFADADLTNANFDGANVEGTNFRGTTLTGADLSKAKNHDKIFTGFGTLGPSLTQLDAIANKAKRIRISFLIRQGPDDQGEPTTIDTARFHYGWGLELPPSVATSRSQNLSVKTVPDAFLTLAKATGHRQVRFETLDIESTKSPTTPKELRDLVIAGITEAFNQTPPADLSALTKAYRDSMKVQETVSKEEREAAKAKAEKEAAKEIKKIEKKIEKEVGKVNDTATFLKALELRIEAAKIDKATKMLKASGFKLFNDVTDSHVNGVVKSQTDPDLVYACRIESDGKYSCCTQNLNVCGGLRGSICKHLLVLIIGLVQANELDPATINDWVAKSNHVKPVLDKETMGEVFIRYKGAEAGEVDWRPTETVPEDYYSL